jgi:type II secretory pathway pseudopilin PulG
MNNKIKKQTFLLKRYLIIIVVVISILAGFMVPQYTRSREQTIDKQAVAILNIIRAAERSYRISTGTYYPFSSSVNSVNQINSALVIDLVDDGKWGYYLETLNTGRNFRAVLDRTGADYHREWEVTDTDETPDCTHLDGPNWCP